MADQGDVRRIALSLPGTVEEEGRFAFSVMDKGKARGIAWVWRERLEPRKARVPNAAVLAVRVEGPVEKELLLASDDEKFFTEPHYNGYPAVLVRLAAVDEGELEALLTSAWRCQAPKALLAAHDGAVAPAARTAKKASARPAAKKASARPAAKTAKKASARPAAKTAKKASAAAKARRR
jgi:hypothetical protein